MLGVIMVVNKVVSSIIREGNLPEVRSLPGVVKAPAKSHLVVEKVEERTWMCKTMDPFSNFLLRPFNSRIFLWALLCHRRLDHRQPGIHLLLIRAHPMCLWG